jgi:hypothetical protein
VISTQITGRQWTGENGEKENAHDHCTQAHDLGSCPGGYEWSGVNDW